MPNALIAKLRADRDAAKATANALIEKQGAGTDLSEAEAQNLESLTKNATELDARIRQLTEMELADIEAKTLDNKLDTARVEFGATPKPPKLEAFKVSNLGRDFVESDVYRSFLATPSGKSGLYTSEFALIDTGGGTIPGAHRASDSPMPAFTTPLLDAIGYEPVSSNSIDWISWPAAVPVAGNVAEGALKLEADYLPILNTKALDKQAHHVPVTREMLEDVARAQAIISGALMNGVRKKIENDAASRLVTSIGTKQASSDTLLKSIRVGVALVSEGGWQPNCVVVNPLDYAKLDLELLTLTVNGALLGKSVWGLSVVPNSSIPADTAFVLDGTNSMTLFDRRVSNLYITDSHADEFTSNILRILAEARTRTEIVRPEAIAKCTVVVGP